MDQFLVSEQSSLTLISFTAKVILNQFLVTNSYLRSQALWRQFLELFCIFSLSFCKNLSFELTSVIIHMFGRKRAGSFQPTTWFPCMEVTAYSHILLNFFGYVVRGSVESFNVEKVVWVQRSDNLTDYSPSTNSWLVCFAVHSSISNLNSRMACTL